MADRDPQRDRAIRRAIEAVAHVKRPAGWMLADYMRFEKALRENGYELRQVEEAARG